MTENPHEKEDLKEKPEKLPEKREKPDRGGAWSEDQTRRSYYYDDACGYETYNADEDEERED